MKSIPIYALISFFGILTSCNQKGVNIEANYTDLPESENEKIEEVLKTKNSSFTQNTYNVLEEYAKEYLLASSNPVSSGIASNYFWYVYNALPSFVDEKERHNGYYKDENEQSAEERLIAYAIYRLDRSPENITKIFEMVKPKLSEFLPKQTYESLMIDNEVNARIHTYKRIVQIDNYKELLTEAYNHADTATGILYADGDEANFETFNGAYGLDVYSLSEIISQHFEMDRYDSYYGNTALSFWMRRNKEGNMETVYEILLEIQSMYKD